MLAQLFAGNGGLAEGDAAVVSGDFAMSEDLKTVAAQRVEAAFEQKRILEATTAEADAVEL